MSSRPLLSLSLGSFPTPVPDAGLLPHWEVSAVHDLASARRALKRTRYPVGLLLLGDLREAQLLELQALLEAHAGVRWVGLFLPGLIRLPACRALVVEHLFDFFTLPVDPQRLDHTLGHACGFAELAGQPASTEPMEDEAALVGQSAAMVQLRRQIAKVAHASAPVLIWGESGSGKELTAQAIHRQSARAAAPFVAVNCGAIPASLIQSELFGHERGAFTGAARDNRGLIEAAQGGTLFLDEIGDLPLELQANLLRFLQEGTINRVGSARSIPVDARVVAASHMKLEQLVQQGRFREDLFYRLHVLPLTVPALRERKDDLEALAWHFFRLYSRDKGPRLSGFSTRALQAIQAHDWPGNVRELINRIRRAMVMTDARLIQPEDLDLSLPDSSQDGGLLEAARLRAEVEAIHASLLYSGHNITGAARHLGVSRMTLYRLLDKHGLNP